MEEDVECTGTARATHEISEYERLEREYDEDVALTVTTKAFQRSFPEISRNDVKSAVKVVRAARSGKVDVAAQRHIMEKQAAKAAQQIFHEISSEEKVD